MVTILPIFQRVRSGFAAKKLWKIMFLRVKCWNTLIFCWWVSYSLKNSVQIQRRTQWSRTRRLLWASAIFHCRASKNEPIGDRTVLYDMVNWNLTTYLPDAFSGRESSGNFEIVFFIFSLRLELIWICLYRSLNKKPACNQAGFNV